MTLDTKALKVGDEVVIRLSHHYRNDIAIGTVVSVTPTGRVKIKNEYGRFYEFNANGKARGGYGDTIEAMTDEHRATIQEATDRRKLGQALDRIKTWDIATIRRVLRAIEEES